MGELHFRFNSLRVSRDPAVNSSLVQEWIAFSGYVRVLLLGTT